MEVHLPYMDPMGYEKHIHKFTNMAVSSRFIDLYSMTRVSLPKIPLFKGVHPKFPHIFSDIYRGPPGSELHV